mmetsp:Transcript_105085/g.234493  ORF Transcript_105085/g.234493 Transcript_105085/m.234493 type:complete len:253 (+) Transcript_105085:451-1209(+)
MPVYGSLLLDVCGLDGLQLRCVLVGRVPEKLLHIAEPLPHRGVMGLARLRLARELGVRRLDGLNVPGVLVGRVTHHSFKVVHTLLYRAVVDVLRRLLVGEVGMAFLQLINGGAVLLAGGKASMHLVQLGMCGCQLPGVLLSGIPDGFLNVIDALAHRGMVRLALGLLVGKASMGLLQVLDRGAVGLARGNPAAHLVELGMGGRQFLCMLVRGVAQELLDVVQALLYRGVVHELCMVLPEATVELVHSVASCF